MARGNSNRGQRDASDIASELDELLAPPTFRAIEYTNPLLGMAARHVWEEIEDRRLFSPERGFAPALSFSGNQAPAKTIPKRDRTWSSIQFDRPNEALICARRKERREVIFAKRRRGRGGSRRRRNYYSNIRC